MRNRTENFIILLVSLTCMGITIESLLCGWEFWVPPLLILGMLGAWAMNITQSPDFMVRKVYYLVYTMLTLFYYGVHETSFFDASLVTVLVMVAFSFFGHVSMMNLLLAEFVIIEMIQFMLAPEGIAFDALTISRVIIHIAAVVLVYFLCSRLIFEWTVTTDEIRQKDARIEAYDADMEDFLSNISHELRTPVNVVNGMSNLLLKRPDVSEALPIKEAGLRLQYQIEDIQDYTECKRKKVILEEEDYMTPSLINDAVTSYRLIDNNSKLELVVDMSPTVPIKLHGDIKKLHKIFRHLLENAFKFTKRGGIYVRMYTEKTFYGVNLCIEVEDTGIGMDRRALSSVSDGLYQVNKKRNRSSGGIGLGLYIVYGFAHRMGGFVKIESVRHAGTMVRVTIPQRVADENPCLSLSKSRPQDGAVLFHVRSDKYKVPKVRDFYRAMATNLAYGLRVPLYSAETTADIDRLRKKIDAEFVFLGQDEYEKDPAYFDKLSEEIIVTVSTNADFVPNRKSRVMVMPKPLYAYPVVKILNEGRDATQIEYADAEEKPDFAGIRTLVVDDEPMNLVVAESLFKDYNMVIDLAQSGEESIAKYRNNDYDVVFMDHMMPEMDGVEAMKRIRRVAADTGRSITIIVLTANVVSGAREMFIEEGFDAFLSKPLNISDFERVMKRVLPAEKSDTKGGEAQ